MLSVYEPTTCYYKTEYCVTQTMLLSDFYDRHSNFQSDTDDQARIVRQVLMWNWTRIVLYNRTEHKIII